MTRRRADATFWAAAFGLGLLVLAVERLVLAAAFRTNEPIAEVAASFVHGLRFDAAGLAYPFLVAAIVSAVAGGLRRSDGGAVRSAACALGFTAIVAAVEVPFFREFRVRLDFVALEYLDDPGEALGLSAAALGTAGVAVVVGSAALATWACVAALRRVRSATIDRAPRPSRPDAVATIAVVAALFVLSRGGFGRPIRPQDADRSAHPLVNQLDLSGPMTLARHVYEWATDRGVTLADYGVAGDEAAAIVRNEPFEGPPLDGEHPRVFEVDGTGRRDLVGANVVIVLLESFSARHVGICGAEAADAWTPRFDALVYKGRAFRFVNFWASGPSTNRAVPAIFASFPSLPDRLAVTKSAAGQQDFRALPRILGELGWDACFVSGGAEEWENLGGWLRQQGFAAVVGRADFDAPWRDAPWGPPDAVLLDRVLAECDARAARGKFLVAALTSTNHPPFPVPDDELGRSVPGATDRERAMRYADAAIGRFMDAALARPWAKDTVFLLLGDHGFHEEPQAEIDPDRYRVPLIVVQPEGRHVNPVRTYPTTAFCEWLLPASQVDVLPMVLRFVAPAGTRYATWGAVPMFFKPEQDRIVVLGPHGGEPVAAALDAAGNYLVERLDGGRPRLFRLVGGDVRTELAVDDAATEARFAARAKEPPWPTGRLVPHDDPVAEARLRRYLRAYLASAARVLASRNAGGR